MIGWILVEVEVWVWFFRSLVLFVVVVGCSFFNVCIIV